MKFYFFIEKKYNSFNLIGVTLTYYLNLFETMMQPKNHIKIHVTNFTFNASVNKDILGSIAWSRLYAKLNQFFVLLKSGKFKC